MALKALTSFGKYLSLCDKRYEENAICVAFIMAALHILAAENYAISGIGGTLVDFQQLRTGENENETALIQATNIWGMQTTRRNTTNKIKWLTQLNVDNGYLYKYSANTLDEVCNTLLKSAGGYKNTTLAINMGFISMCIIMVIGVCQRHPSFLMPFIVIYFTDYLITLVSVTSRPMSPDVTIYINGTKAMPFRNIFMTIDTYNALVASSIIFIVMMMRLWLIYVVYRCYDHFICQEEEEEKTSTSENGKCMQVIAYELVDDKSLPNEEPPSYTENDEQQRSDVEALTTSE